MGRGSLWQGVTLGSPHQRGGRTPQISGVSNPGTIVISCPLSVAAKNGSQLASRSHFRNHLFQEIVHTQLGLLQLPEAFGLLS